MNILNYGVKQPAVPKGETLSRALRPFTGSAFVATRAEALSRRPVTPSHIRAFHLNIVGARANNKYDMYNNNNNNNNNESMLN